MRFGHKGKLSPRYIGPFEILERVGLVAYRIALPPALSKIHNVFHVSSLRKYILDPSHILDFQPIQIREDLTYDEQPIKILDRKEQVLRRRTIRFVQVLWQNHGTKEATWELEEEMRTSYPHLFRDLAGLTDHKIVDTPIELNAHLTPSSGELLPDPTLYWQLVGSLVYLTVTRPDISYAVHQVSQFMFAPRLTHYAAVLRILRYLKGTLFHGLHFFAQSPLILRAYSDANWNLGVSTSSATPIYCDNRSAIQIARNDVFHKRTKHIEIDCHLVRHHLLQGSLQLISVSTHNQLADIFIKSHPTGHFHDLVSKL
uniref:Tf2-1-like SH3-like domain-containing protein n=1 Tax=Fagus sylvatica TaxID=28930 RepID=A0A2N9HZT1_FAGSY